MTAPVCSPVAHTAGPLYISDEDPNGVIPRDEAYALRTDGWSIAAIWKDAGHDKGESEANAARIVACWNAMEGLSNEQVAALRKSHADLLVALNDARTYVEATTLNVTNPKTHKNYSGCLRRIDAAIAKATGSAT